MNRGDLVYVLVWAVAYFGCEVQARWQYRNVGFWIFWKCIGVIFLIFLIITVFNILSV
jgi:hypothetical protein